MSSRSTVRSSAAWEKDLEDSAIVAAVVSLADTLGFVTIAEGVETGLQRDILGGLGCSRAQGFLFARPMAVAEAEAALDHAARRSLRRGEDLDGGTAAQSAPDQRPDPDRSTICGSPLIVATRAKARQPPPPPPPLKRQRYVQNSHPLVPNRRQGLGVRHSPRTSRRPLWRLPCLNQRSPPTPSIPRYFWVSWPKSRRVTSRPACLSNGRASPARLPTVSTMSSSPTRHSAPSSPASARWSAKKAGCRSGWCSADGPRAGPRASNRSTT